MEKEQRKKLKGQLTESYGNIVYTHKCHLKCMEGIDTRNKWLKRIQIGLTAVTTSGIFATIIFDEWWLKALSGFTSLISLTIRLYYKEYNLIETSHQHRTVAHKLWIMREAYVSLLTDFDELSLEEIRFKREELTHRTGLIYSESPQTNPKSFKKTQKALKIKREHMFTNDEKDGLLPPHLRSKAIERTEKDE